MSPTVTQIDTIPVQTNQHTGNEFPQLIDPSRKYLFYIHGKIIEDQGIPAVSPDYGEYHYEEILQTLTSNDFIVISDVRAKNTDSVLYARKVTAQIESLLDAGVPPHQITVVGASKGAGISVFVSHFLENREVNFVILAICHPEVVQDFKRENIYMIGNILSIYDSSDVYGGSCQELFSFSEGKGISNYDEIVLELGLGHGLLYRPFNAWVLPVVNWTITNKTGE